MIVEAPETDELGLAIASAASPAVDEETIVKVHHWIERHSRDPEIWAVVRVVRTLGYGGAVRSVTRSFVCFRANRAVAAAEACLLDGRGDREGNSIK